MVRAARFGADFEAYRAASKDALVGIVQIETKEILAELDAVAAIDGVDVLFVGPLDLSLALGTYDQPDHPRFLEAVGATAAAARKAGKAAGVLLRSPEEFPTYHELGFRLIACGSDSGFVSSGARNTAESLKRLCSASSKKA
jgi:4-hydroxy-2-oxoheptanedioate aldolase